MQKVPAKSDRHLGDDGHFFYKVLIFLLTIPIKYCKLKQKLFEVSLTTVEDKIMVLQLPKIRNLPKSLPMESAVRIEISEGIPILKASLPIQNRIEDLLFKQRESSLTEDENKELLLYEELNDYLTFTNLITQNMILKRLQYVAA